MTGTATATIERSATERRPADFKRINIAVTDTVYDEVNRIAQSTRRSITELVRLGLGLVKIAIDEGQKGNKIIVTTPSGQPIKEIVLPQ